MNFETNRAEFDFPTWGGTPNISYLLLSTPRSGSNMLVRALWQSGVAGAPEEYLTKQFMEDFSLRFALTKENLVSENAWRSGAVVAFGSIEEYFRRLMEVRTSPNGVFGLKMHASHFFLDHLRLTNIRHQLSIEKLVRIRRRDCVKQAISLILAKETNQWIVDPEWNSVSQEKSRPSQSIEYNRKRISNTIQYLNCLELFLDELVSDWGLPLKTVYYEDLCKDYRKEMFRIFSFIGVPVSERVDEVNIKRQVDQTKAIWYEKYNRET
ncbi:Stf0 family sulfotransferase [Sulfitobacter sp. R86518]|uniref:Stf0 family sulfotransferase n=1 Tax=Sulfitobacter sp. R86518 TaxID=3093858 RepID=UPI0036DD3FAC